jgi:hypothetical protein
MKKKYWVYLQSGIYEVGCSLPCDVRTYLPSDTHIEESST